MVQVPPTSTVRLDLGIPLDGSQWIVQVQPTSTLRLDSGIPLDGSQWIVQVQPTEEAEHVIRSEDSGT
jgi:hypothetical protein